jgi:hypothetical protein
VSEPEPSSVPVILRQLLGSEKFIYVSVLFMLPITIFTMMGLMTIDDWRHDALWALGFLIGGKTIQGVADRIGPAAARGASDQATTSAAAVTVNVPAPAPTAAPPAGVSPPPPIRSGTEP